MAQCFHWSSADNVLFQDPHRALRVDPGVPDIVGVDHDHGTVSALIHAPGVVDADDPLQAPLRRALLERFMDFLRALRRAGLSGSADKDVMAVLTHEMGDGRREMRPLPYDGKLPLGAV